MPKRPKYINRRAVKCVTTWRNMMARCYEPTANAYEHYGAKGVYVCPEWHNYRAFEEWYYTQCESLEIDPLKNEYHVDKDDLGEFLSVKYYSPLTCKLLHNKVNTALSSSKGYHVVCPKGNVYQGTNLAEFCRHHKLNRGNMSSVVNGNKAHYKQWRKYYGA